MRFLHLSSHAAAILLLGCAGASAAPATLARVQILVEDAASPWSDHGGHGYANDLVLAAFAAAGVEVELKVVPYARCKAMVLRGDAISCFSMSASPELGNLVRFSDQPLFSVTPRFYYNTDHKVTAKSVADLTAGMRVGIVRGYEYPPFVAQLAQRGIVVESGRSDVANLRKLAAGRIDVALVMTDEMRNEEVIFGQAGVDHIAFGFKSEPMESFIGFSTRHPFSDALRRNFNTGYRLISQNGTRSRIQARWKLNCAKTCPE